MIALRYWSDDLRAHDDSVVAVKASWDEPFRRILGFQISRRCGLTLHRDGRVETLGRAQAPPPVRQEVIENFVATAETGRGARVDILTKDGTTFPVAGGLTSDAAEELAWNLYGCLYALRMSLDGIHRFAVRRAPPPTRPVS